MITYRTYRNGASADLQERIKAAVSQFYKDRGSLPKSVMVHKSELGAATLALQALSLRLSARCTGGCLAGEVWLEIQET